MPASSAATVTMDPADVPAGPATGAGYPLLPPLSVLL
jgi:hypothetical protein